MTVDTIHRAVDLIIKDITSPISNTELRDAWEALDPVAKGFYRQEWFDIIHKTLKGIILTATEQTSDNFLDWSNETLGKLVRHTAQLIHDKRGDASSRTQAAVLLIVTTLAQSGNTEATFAMEGVTLGGVEQGDWILTAKRVDKTTPTPKEGLH